MTSRTVEEAPLTSPRLRPPRLQPCAEACASRLQPCAFGLQPCAIRRVRSETLRVQASPTGPFFLEPAVGAGGASPSPLILWATLGVGVGVGEAWLLHRSSSARARQRSGSWRRVPRREARPGDLACYPTLRPCTCYLHAICMPFACSAHAICLLSACLCLLRMPY